MCIRETLIEIIQKECELYRLKEFRLLTSAEEEADRLLSFWPDIINEHFADVGQFKEWKKMILIRFYSQIGYTDFLRQNKSKTPFIRFLLSLRKRQVRWLQEHWKEDTIDSSLAMPLHTLAFKLSVLLSAEADELLFPYIDSFRTPYELENRCDAYCKGYFPITLEKLMISLRKDDKEFWNDIYLLVKQIAVRVTSYLLLSNQYKEEVEQDTWSESSLFFREKILSETLPVFDSALHLRNHLVRICQNKCHEVMRRNRQQEIPVDNPELILDIIPTRADEDLNFVLHDMDAYRLSDIDADCNYEVSSALTVILWDKAEPWYTVLAEGIEDKILTFRQHYVDGLSYAQIVLLQAPSISEPDQLRMQARLRQDVVRVRKLLKERFLKMLKDL